MQCIFDSKAPEGKRMPKTPEYATAQPARTDIDVLAGAAVLDFGTNWCGYCCAAQSLVAEAFVRHASVRHIKVEDGSGRALGRSFRIKLWPTLVFLRDGKEVARLVRPTEVGAIEQALAVIDAPA